MAPFGGGQTVIAYTCSVFYLGHAVARFRGISTMVASTPASFRRSSPLDRLLSEADRALRVLTGATSGTRPNPAAKLRGALPAAASEPLAVVDDVAALTPAESRHAAGLMRVNHVGEVCAQALYRGQALVCKNAAVREVFVHAAVEETDHLTWLAERLKELKSRPSLLNPLWYAGSFALGALAGKAGDAFNLGFMAETEKQVERHLHGHLQSLPVNDVRSRVIVEQMCDDERQHRLTAEKEGAARLPSAVQMAMTATSKAMTTTSYYL